MKLRNRTRIIFGIILLISLTSVLCLKVFASDTSFKTFERKDKLAIFDNKNKQLTDYIFDKVYQSPYIKPNGHSYANSITKFPYYGLILVKKDGQFAYLNEKCQEVIAYNTYDSITPMSYYGYSMVRKGCKWGVIDKQCKLVAPLVFDMISQEPLVSYENAFKSFLVKTDDKFRILDGNAEWTLKLEFDSVKILFDNFYLATTGKKLYLIDNNCSILSDKYTTVCSIDEGFIVTKDKKMGIVDNHNSTLIPFIYDSIYAPRLQPYYFAFRDDKCGVIDLKGKTIIPFDYEQILEAWEDTNNGEQEHLIVQKNQKFGTISFKNEVVTPIEYDGISGWVEYGPDAHYIVQNEKWGLISYDGKVLIPTIYDSIQYHTNSLIECKKNGKYGVLDINNKEIVRCENDSLIIDYDYFGQSETKGKLKIKNNGIWKHLDLNGKPLQENHFEEEVEK